MRVVKRYAPALLRAITRGADDAGLEQRFGSPRVQRAIFAALAAGFDPRAAGGFHGQLVYVLSRPETRRPPTQWTITVLNGHAVARPGSVDDPVLTIRYRLADFIRVAAGLVDPALPMLHDRASFEGDLALAVKVPEMFRAPRPR